MAAHGQPQQCINRVLANPPFNHAAAAGGAAAPTIPELGAIFTHLANHMAIRLVYITSLRKMMHICNTCGLHHRDLLRRLNDYNNMPGAKRTGGGAATAIKFEFDQSNIVNSLYTNDRLRGPATLRPAWDHYVDAIVDPVVGAGHNTLDALLHFTAGGDNEHFFNGIYSYCHNVITHINFITQLNLIDDTVINSINRYEDFMKIVEDVIHPPVIPAAAAAAVGITDTFDNLTAAIHRIFSNDTDDLQTSMAAIFAQINGPAGPITLNAAILNKLTNATNVAQAAAAHVPGHNMLSITDNTAGHHLGLAFPIHNLVRIYMHYYNTTTDILSICVSNFMLKYQNMSTPVIINVAAGACPAIATHANKNAVAHTNFTAGIVVPAALGAIGPGIHYTINFENFLLAIIQNNDPSWQLEANDMVLLDWCLYVHIDTTAAAVVLPQPRIDTLPKFNLTMIYDYFETILNNMQTFINTHDTIALQLPFAPGAVGADVVEFYFCDLLIRIITHAAARPPGDPVLLVLNVAQNEFIPSKLLNMLTYYSDDMTQILSDDFLYRLKNKFSGGNNAACANNSFIALISYCSILATICAHVARGAGPPAPSTVAAHVGDPWVAVLPHAAAGVLPVPPAAGTTYTIAEAIQCIA
jgi:hypothetical protein